MLWELPGVPGPGGPGVRRGGAMVYADLRNPGRFWGAQELDFGRYVEKPCGGICPWVIKDTCPVQGLMYPCTLPPLGRTGVSMDCLWSVLPGGLPV